MKQNKCLPAYNKGIIKVLLLMKFSVVFILLTSLQLSARTYSQDRITLKLEAAGLKTALKQIEKKSIFRFLYNDDIMSSNQKVSINVINKPVKELLDDIFNSTALTYRILENNLVVVTQKSLVAQDIKVTGKVLSPTGTPIPAATVKIKGSNVSTTTDATGSFSLSVPEGAEDLSLAISLAMGPRSYR